jgi:oligopeptide/dipeptide ABC transporter ATP-binding protein
MNKNSQQSNTALLEVRELSLSFRHQKNAIDHVSFKLEAGKTLGLVGASGAGKSSIARAILHLLKPDTGAILFNGQDISNMDQRKLREVRRRMQIVFQEPSSSLSPRRTVQQTLLEPLRHFALGDSDYRQRKIRQTLQTVGLGEDVLQRYPHQFSTGQQQRIAIARALITNPDLLIADEIVSALDVSIQAQILQLIQSLQQERGIAFLFISHDLAVIRQIADNVAVMYCGQLLENAPANSFFSQPAHPYSKALLSFANFNSPTEFAPGQGPADHMSACIYSDRCAEKMPVCDQLKPEFHKIRHKNASHCVKCHLYDEKKTNDT